MSERIQILSQLPTRNIVYDLFCDHGLIGLSILKSNPEKKIIFNDIKPDLIEHLRMKKIEGEIEYLCADARKIHFDPHASVILAGVGEDLMLEVVASIPSTCELIINTRFNPIKLRTHLKNWKLKSETLLKERDQFFEILVLGNEGIELSPFFHFSPKPDKLTQEYLKDLIEFAWNKSKWDRAWVGYYQQLQAIETTCLS